MKPRLFPSTNTITTKYAARGFHNTTKINFIMKKYLVFAIFIMLSGSTFYGQSSFYDFTVKDINGNDFPLSQLKGKKVMVVNTASKCGHTPQYANLESLYKKYKDRNFVIIGFPANNFLNQEPGSNKQIKDYCQVNYGVTFPMMSKISVKGDNIHPLYKWLTDKTLNGLEDSEVKWNFQKYLINESGRIEDIIPPNENPESQKVMDWITRN
jgi:glutathione peroxidase